MSIMTDGTIMKYAGQMGPYKKYSSQYTWTLYDWSLIHESNHKIGATSTKFILNGTSGYTCKLSLCPTYSDWTFNVEFSDTRGIKAMKITSTFNGIGLSKSTYNKEIPRQLAQPIGVRLTKSDPNYILKDSKTDTLRIVIIITIVRESDSFDPPAAATRVSPTVLSTSTINSFLPKIKAMLEQKILCDITFVLGAKTFDAHKVVLAVQSKVFEAMFSSGMKEQTEDIIELTDTPADVFEEFLNYLYTGKLTQFGRMVEKIIVLADFYNVSDLKIMCENIMLESLSEDTVIEYVILADKLNCDTLKNEALCLIRSKAEVLENALLEEDDATVRCLKEILSKNQPKYNQKDSE